MRRLHEHIYLYIVGPGVLASAVGTAASPGGWGGFSVFTTEIAWRAFIQTAMNQQANESRHAANAASMIGMAAVPGALSSLATAVAHEAHAEQFPIVQPLPSLFEIQPVVDREPAQADGPGNR
jgi:hypothetical protein